MKIMTADGWKDIQCAGAIPCTDKTQYRTLEQRWLDMAMGRDVEPMPLPKKKKQLWERPGQYLRRLYEPKRKSKKGRY